MKTDKQFFAQFNSVQHFKRGEIIIRAGDEPSGVYYLKKGFVRLYLISIDGKETTYNIYKPGTYFSLIWAISDTPNIYFFESLTGVEVLKAPKNQVVKFFKSRPDILCDLIKRTLIGLDGTIKLTQALLMGAASQKIASAILVLTRRFGEKKKNGEIVIQLTITHKIVASMCNLSREKTSYELMKLKKEKIITTINKYIVVKSVKKLEEKSPIPEIEKYTFIL